MGRHGKRTWSVEELPIGTIRIRAQSPRGGRVRMIKVRMDGPRSGRWIRLARYWWETSRGPIPGGMRVVHRDGNLLNDDPSNYMLVTAGDVLYLARQWDPKLDARIRRACSMATARANRDRSRVTRAKRLFSTSYYAVDVDVGVVINEPFRSRTELFRRHVGEASFRNGSGHVGPWLGWPDRGGLEACLLAVLVELVCGRYPAIIEALTALRTHQDWQPHRPLIHSVRTAAYRLRQAGLLGGTRGYLVIHSRAIQCRVEPCPYVALRGAAIEERYGDFPRIWPEQLPERINGRRCE